MVKVDKITKDIAAKRSALLKQGVDLKDAIFQYVRKGTKFDEDGRMIKRGTPIGIVAAFSSGEVGWSLCNEDDDWNKRYGKYIACIRAKYEPVTFIDEDEVDATLIPQSVLETVKSMVVRAKKYFNK